MHLLPKFEIFVDQSLSFTFGNIQSKIPELHELYAKCDRTFNNITLSKFILQMTQYTLCIGFTTLDPSISISFQKHVIPKKFNYLEFQQKQFKTTLNQDEYNRSSCCKMLVSDQRNPCLPCQSHNIKCVNDSNRKKES